MGFLDLLQLDEALLRLRVAGSGYAPPPPDLRRCVGGLTMILMKQEGRR